LPQTPPRKNGSTFPSDFDENAQAISAAAGTLRRATRFRRIKWPMRRSADG
jgi:hypothetical protein